MVFEGAAPSTGLSPVQAGAAVVVDAIGSLLEADGRSVFRACRATGSEARRDLGDLGVGIAEENRAAEPASADASEHPGVRFDLGGQARLRIVPHGIRRERDLDDVSVVWKAPAPPEPPTVRRLLARVGVDGVRFYLLRVRPSSLRLFDEAAAREQRETNPLYSVQLAHARMVAVARDHACPAEAGRGPDAAMDAVLRELRTFPAVIHRAARAHAPHRVASYLVRAARIVHEWYHRQWAIGEPPAGDLPVATADAARIVLANGLRLLGITAPLRM